MPTVSIYIKNEDYSKYLSIENKSQFIHNALVALESDIESIVNKMEKPEYITPIIKTPEDAKKKVENTGYISKSFSARKKK